MGDEQFTADRLELEEVLVQHFKLLKEIVALTRKERDSLLADPAALLLGMVEEKEALLDRLSLTEDRCRRIVQSLSLSLGLRTEHTSIQDLLPSLSADDARRIRHLSEGISSLAGQARELNRANGAIALTKLEWLKATQAFLISILQPEAGYRSPKGNLPRADITGLGVEFHV